MPEPDHDPRPLPADPVRDARARALRDLRISVTDRCNFRCPYCMPKADFEGHHFLPPAEQLTFDEIARLVRQFVPLGIRKVRLTGGEPLLRPHLPELVRRLRAIDGIEDLALTTNGSMLAAQAADLHAAGLHRVTVSLDSLDPAIFAQLSGGRGRVEDVLAGMAEARRVGLGPLKINAVVERGINDAGVVDLVEHFRGTDVGNHNGWDPARVVPSAELLARVAARWPLVPRAPLVRGEVARRYAFADGQGEVGFISSVTAPFCGDCARARLSSDGVLYTCLFAARGTSLRDPLRAGATDDALGALVRQVWTARDDRYSEQRATLIRAPSRRAKVEMHVVGG